MQTFLYFSRHIPAAHYASTNGELSRAFDKLAAIHPVTLDGKPPSRTLASMFYFIKPKSIIDKWAYAQRAIRVHHITGKHISSISIGMLQKKNGVRPLSECLGLRSYGEQFFDESAFEKLAGIHQFTLHEN